jgi:hypothetical protein
MYYLRFKNSLAFYNAGIVAVNSKVVGLGPAIAGYNASVVKINSATNGIARF